MSEREDLPACTPENIVAARRESGLTAEEAAHLVGVSGFRTWLKWELGDRPMKTAFWELFLHKVGQREIPFGKNVAHLSKK